LRSIAYRPDIDCLRAFAVIAVIAYHYDIPPFRSGFVGVDVFFVISGFLITRIIRTEIGAGAFSFAAFYQRRARRILPAAFAMLAAVLACSSLLLLPQESTSVAAQALAMLTFSSNVLFWSQQGYFDSAAITKPLLHTWSLAVEEQYYLLFPAAAAFAFSFRKPAVVTGFALVGAASLAVCIIQTALQPDAAFYLLPARAWEFALGALLALEALPDPPKPWVRIVAATVGWVLLGLSVNVFTSRTPYPGVNALLPCLGAAIVIWAQPTPGKALLVAVRPMIAVGLLSYSLYLWHWPVASFAYTIWGPPTSAAGRLALVTCCSVLSILSYVIVERPARHADWRISWRALAAAVAVALAVSTTTIWLAGFPSRFSPDELKIASYLDYDYQPVYEARSCFLVPGQSVRDLAPSCIAPGTAPNILLWGDSHAAHLGFGLTRALGSAAVMRATMAQCLPFPAFRQTQACTEFNRSMRDTVHALKPDVVVISANWSDQALTAAARVSLVATINSITDGGSKVVVIGPSPQYDNALPRILVAALHFGAPSSGHLRPFVADTDATLRELIKDLPQTEYVSLVALMCPGSVCQLLASGAPTAWDEGHFTAEGSQLAANLILSASTALRQTLHKPATSVSE
jgi:peptidoglycan/LPS O-acetylase OafA/YrhL